jgi:autoinducer-2 kinase
MGHLLAIDAGTGGCRAVVFTDEGGYVAEAGRRWTQPADPRDPGAAGFDTEAAWRLIGACVRESLAAAGIPGREVRAVSAASVRGGLVLRDGAGRELWACGSTDARAARQVERVRRADPGFEREAYRRSGQTLAMSAVPRLLWLRDHLPAVYEAAATLGMISDWVLARLGGMPAVDPSNACTTGLLSLAGRDWAPELASRWGLRTDLLPPVVEPGTVTGEVSPAAAADTGLAAGVPVVMGGGDAQLGALGLGVVHPGQAAVVGGTHWQQLVNLDRPATDDRARVRVTCHAIDGLWQLETIALGSGAAVRWFLDAFCETETAAGDPFGAMAEQARRVPAGSEGVLAVLSNAMDYLHWRHAAPSLLNLPVRDAARTRAVLFRALLENAALVTRANLEAIAACRGLPAELVAFGGGAARSELWARILADVLRLPVRVPPVTGATALGAAILAGVGAGAFDDAGSAAAALAGGGRVHQPDPATEAAYQDSFERWRSAYASQLALAEQGVTTPLWTAPGGAGAAADGPLASAARGDDLKEAER